MRIILFLCPIRKARVQVPHRSAAVKVGMLIDKAPSRQEMFKNFLLKGIQIICISKTAQKKKRKKYEKKNSDGTDVGTIAYEYPRKRNR